MKYLFSYVIVFLLLCGFAIFGWHILSHGAHQLPPIVLLACGVIALPTALVFVFLFYED